MRILNTKVVVTFNLRLPKSKVTTTINSICLLFLLISSIWFMLELVCFGLDFSIFIFVLLILLDSLRLGSTIAVVVLTIFLLWLESSLSDPDSALLGIDFKINTYNHKIVLSVNIQEVLLGISLFRNKKVYA